MTSCGTPVLLRYQFLYFRNNQYVYFAFYIICFWISLSDFILSLFINRLEVILVGVMHFGWRLYWCFHLLFWDLLWSLCSWKVHIFVLPWFLVAPLILFSISKLFVDPGFVPADSEKALALGTVESGVQGTIMF